MKVWIKVLGFCGGYYWEEVEKSEVPPGTRFRRSPPKPRIRGDGLNGWDQENDGKSGTHSDGRSGF